MNDATMIEADPWLAPIPEPKKSKVPVWAWMVGGLMILVCGIISIGAAFVFMTQNNGEGATRIVEGVEVTVVVADTQENVPATDTVAAEGPTATATAEPTDRPSATPNPSPTMTPDISPTPTINASPNVVVVSRFQLGQSTENRPIEIVRIGSGSQHLVFIGALHGNEPGTQRLVAELAEHFEDNTNLIDSDYTLHFIPGLNPDGVVANSRYTANGVDINRNWDTPNWTADAPQPDGADGTGGTAPFSEPETAVLHDYLETLLADNPDSIGVVIYHAHAGVPGTGRIQPGYVQPGSPVPFSISLAETLIGSGDYNYVATCCGSYTPTGEISNWLAINNIAAVDLELPSGGRPNETVDGETILERAIDDVLNLLAG
jgi:hypothetical protein